VLYQSLTGQIPYPRDTDAATLWAHVSAPAPVPSELRPDLPHGLDEVVSRGMAKEPDERYATAGELARDCALAVGIEDSEIPPAPPAARPASDADADDGAASQATRTRLSTPAQRADGTRLSTPANGADGTRLSTPANGADGTTPTHLSQ
jgi:serine/threonine-protein kinase